MAGSRRQRWRVSSEALLTAALAGVFGITGAYIGGQTANHGARDLQRAEATRADQRDAAATRGAARLLYDELAKVRTNVLAAGDDHRWWPLDYRVRLTPSDRGLLAQRLSADEWNAVSRALAAIAWLPATMRDGFDWKPRRDSEDMDLVVGVARNATAALDALRPVAGTPRAQQLPLPASVAEYARQQDP